VACRHTSDTTSLVSVIPDPNHSQTSSVDSRPPERAGTTRVPSDPLPCRRRRHVRRPCYRGRADTRHAAPASGELRVTGRGRETATSGVRRGAHLHGPSMDSARRRRESDLHSCRCRPRHWACASVTSGLRAQFTGATSQKQRNRTTERNVDALLCFRRARGGHDGRGATRKLLRGPSNTRLRWLQ
jgi:hypothetical protein